MDKEKSTCECGNTAFELVLQFPMKEKVMGVQLKSRGFKAFCSKCGKHKYPLFSE